jgi:demethylmenaquinone methyltransferase/2-methoxy-6-polyprenyl-1,4-benzoquinol methylase
LATSAPTPPPETGSTAPLFGRIARRYDLLNRILSTGRDNAWRRRTVRSLDLLPGPILDLCCGTGDLTATLACRFPDRLVIGADFSLPMLLLAPPKSPAARFAAADAMALPFADGTFAALTCGFGLRNLADRPAALREMARVLLPGGQVAIIEFAPPSGFWRLPATLWVRHATPVIGRIVTGDAAAYRYLADSIAAFPPPDRVLAMMAEAGFTGATATDLHFGAVWLYRGTKG